MIVQIKRKRIRKFRKDKHGSEVMLLLCKIKVLYFFYFFYFTKANEFTYFDKIACLYFLFNVYSLVEKSYEENSYSFTISFSLHSYL